MSKDKRQGGNGGVPAPGRETEPHEAVGFEAQLEQEFLAASKQAMQIHESQKASVSQTRVNRPGWAVAVVMVVVVIVAVGYFFQMEPPGKDDIKLTAVGMKWEHSTGVIVDSRTNKVLPQVRIYRESIPQHANAISLLTPLLVKPAYASQKRGQVTELIGISNSLGYFKLDPEYMGYGNFILQFNNEQVSWQQSEILSPVFGKQGYLEVDIPQLDEGIAILLQPGESRQITPSLSLSLDKGAIEPWSGNFQLSFDWPAIFSYGRVLAGVFECNGAENKDLRITTHLDAQLLDFYKLAPGQIRLLSHSEELANHDPSDLQHNLYTKFHQGWYDMAQPPVALYPESDAEAQRWAGLPKTRPQVEVVPGGTQVTWTPNPGQRYALAAPVVVDGEAVGCILNTPAINKKNEYAAITLMDRKTPGFYFFDVRHVQGNQVDYYPQFPQVEWSTIRLGLNRSRTRPDVRSPIGYLAKTPRSKLPGILNLRCFDFTLTEPVVLNAVHYDLSHFEGQFHVVDLPTERSSIRAVEIAGDVQFLESAPTWDFDLDGITDEVGYKVDFPGDMKGIDPYFAWATDGNSLIKFVRNRVDGWQGTSGSFLITPELISIPVVTAQNSPPAEPASTWQFSRQAYVALGIPQSNSSHIAFPGFYLEIPAEKQDQPLAEMKVSLTCRAGFGTDDMSVAARVITVDSPQQEGGQYLINPTIFAIEKESSSLTAGAVDDYLSQALAEHQANPVDGACSLLHREFGTKEPANLTRTRFIYLFGLEPEELVSQGEAAVVAWIKEYQASDAAKHRNVTGETRTVSWRVNLYGTPISDSGFLVLLSMEDKGLPMAGQYEFFSGGEAQSQVELSFNDGSAITYYLDFAALVQ